jgi:hypothetical protein
MFPGRNVEMFPSKSAKMFPSKAARLFTSVPSVNSRPMVNNCYTINLFLLNLIVKNS